jgi:hypothetical protein
MDPDSEGILSAKAATILTTFGCGGRFWLRFAIRFDVSSGRKTD